jgi:hypothetical protein
MRETDELTEAERKVINQTAPKKCPSCKTKGRFMIGEHCYTLFAVDRVGRQMTQHLPLAVIVCEVCGHVLLRSALVLGLLSNVDEAAEPTEPPEG